MEQREKLSSRLGFILLSAGCAIGIGNVWRFPYICGQYGGGIFVLIYLACLLLLGIPVLTMEYAIGRAGERSIMPAMKRLEKKGTKWHWWGYPAMLGNYILLFFYSVVSGWILYYTYKMATGAFDGTKEEVKQAAAAVYEHMMASPGILILGMVIVMALTVLICSRGLVRSVEKVTKVVMILLLVFMVILGIRSLTLPGAGKGLAFYLEPSLSRVKEAGLFNVIYAALNQSFFTLSVGMGGMAIYGSYIDKKKSLRNEAVIVTALDTFVAIVAGLIVFPACFAFGVEPDAGPSLIFLTLPPVFASMPLGRLWETLFFLFLLCAAMSTMIGVFENCQAFLIDLKGTKRLKAGLINGAVITLGAVPVALGFNVWSSFQPLKAGNTVMDLDDFMVTNLILPIGSFIISLFCTHDHGWGYLSFVKEADEGSGLKVGTRMKWYYRWVVPGLILFLVSYGLYAYFA
jgi:NSS family neurotransmitter:Na+ symporter